MNGYRPKHPLMLFIFSYLLWFILCKKKKDSVSQGSYNYEREIVRDFILPPILTEGITTTFEDIPYATRSSWNFCSSYLKL